MVATPVLVLVPELVLVPQMAQQQQRRRQQLQQAWQLEQALERAPARATAADEEAVVVVALAGGENSLLETSLHER